MVEYIDVICPKCNGYRSIAKNRIEQFIKEDCLMCNPHKFHKENHNISCFECFPKEKCDNKNCEECYPKKTKKEEINEEIVENE